MKGLFVIIIPLIFSCSQSESKPDVQFIMQYKGRVFDGDVREKIESENGELIIDFKRSVPNEYWIARGVKTGVFVKIKEPEYTIVEAYSPADSNIIPLN